MTAVSGFFDYYLAYGADKATGLPMQTIAVFFVLKGKGHDIHDGKPLEWEAGDAHNVENGCVHQHFNDEADGESIVLIMKAKPLFLFMHMLFQKVVAYPPKDPTPGQENYLPPSYL
jgi:gentisate 1,2-dioxygenase